MISQILTMLICLFIAISTGFFTVSLIDRDLQLRFRILYAIPMGFGIHSILYFAYQCLNIYDFHKYQLFEYITVIILAICYYSQDRPRLSKHKFHKLNNWYYVINIYALSFFLQYYLINPMGHWDGFRIWNTKAQFLIIQTPEWQNLFKLPDFLSHCDYPLFCPSTTARMWMYQGGENYFSNVLLGAIFAFTIVYLLYQAISFFKNEKTATIVTSVLLMSNIFMYNAANQCADIPLALFFLSAITSLFLHFKTKRTSTLVLGMIFAGLSSWTKNEGLMFFTVYTSVLIGYFLYKKEKKLLYSIILTIIPFTIFSLWFKSLAPMQNDLIWGVLHQNSYRFLMDKYRYFVVIKTFINLILHPFVLFLSLSILCLKGIKIKEKIKTPFLLSLIIFGLMVLGYFFVYIISPHDINWIVDNSLIRITLQILPVFLLLFAFSLRIGKPDTLN